MQIDGSDEFMYFGEEASISDTQDNLYSPRPIRSGKYKDYVIMGSGLEGSGNAGRGSIL